MNYNFSYFQPVHIHFGKNKMLELSSVLDEMKSEKCILVSSKSFKEKCLCLMESEKRIKDIYCGVHPNPLLSDCEEITALMKENGCDTVIAFGGGSVMDASKFAAACTYSDILPKEHYLSPAFPEKCAKILAIPTTSGTGSEVTKVAVISHRHEKKSIHNDSFYPTACIVDPMLTMSVPKKLTMITGIDAFTHAIEAYWSVNHQPVTDYFAIEAIKLILLNLEKAYTDGDEKSREEMSLGSLLAGLAFSVAKTAASHACSFSISAAYGLPHGEACAFTLPSLIKINADERLEALAKAVGMKNTEELADKIIYLKEISALASKLSDLGDNVDIEMLSEAGANHPLMANNPKKLTKEELMEMYEGLR